MKPCVVSLFLLISICSFGQFHINPIIYQPLTPAAVAPGGPDFTLRVMGNGFDWESVVYWNDTPLATTVLTTRFVTAVVPAALTATAQTAWIRVHNPKPWGGFSNTLYLPVHAVGLSPSFQQVIVGAGSPDLVAADFNGDRNLDVALAQANSFNTFVHLGHGKGLDRSFAYVANEGGGGVSVIDTTSNISFETVGVGSGPIGVAITPDGTRAYVANVFSDSVSVIDTSGNTVIATVDSGRSPSLIAITPDGTRAYVTNNEDASASVIDTASNRVIATIGVVGAPYGVAITPDGTRLYVANVIQFSGTVTVIDTSNNTIIAKVVAGNEPGVVAITPDGTHAYVTNGLSNSVSVIDTVSNTVTATIAVGSIPLGVAITPDGTRAYVTNAGSNSVSVIDTSSNTVIAAIHVKLYPYLLAISPDGTRAYVTNLRSSSVSVIDTMSNTVIATVNVVNGPEGVAASGQLGKQAITCAHQQGGGMVTGDFNFDGITDLAVACSDRISVLKGIGDGTFHHHQDYLVNQPTGLTAVDLNQDGKLDLVFLSGGTELSVMFGNGDGTFQAPVTPVTGLSNAQAIAVGDFNRDGKLDLVVTDADASGNGQLTLLLGTGDGTFQPAVNFPSGGKNPVKILTADFNGDDRLDLAVINQGDGTSVSPASLAIFLGLGYPVPFRFPLVYHPFRPSTFVPTGLVTADLNGDGKLDLAVAGLSAPGSNTSLLSIWPGNGDGTFQASTVVPITGPASQATSIVAGDFNNDGTLDLVVGGSGSVVELLQK